MTFDEVYSEYKEMVWRLVSKYAAQDQDKEDLFQEVFLKIHKALPGFRGDSSPQTWIYRIAVNTAINHIKKKNRIKTLQNMLNLFERDNDSEGRSQEPTNGPLIKPLEKLNPQQRMILLLSDVEEKKLDEIGSLLNLPIGTVKSNLHRAREVLKKEVEKSGEL